MAAVHGWFVSAVVGAVVYVVPLVYVVPSMRRCLVSVAFSMQHT